MLIYFDYCTHNVHMRIDIETDPYSALFISRKSHRHSSLYITALFYLCYIVMYSD